MHNIDNIDYLQKNCDNYKNLQIAYNLFEKDTAVVSSPIPSDKRKQELSQIKTINHGI